MKFVHSMRRSRYLTVTLVVAIAAFIGVAFFGSRAYQREKSRDAAALKKEYHAQIKKGVGTEVRFAHSKSSSAQVRDSVESVDAFIKGRASLGMSDETKGRLAALEAAALKSGGRISTSALSAALADTITERVKTLTDREIDAAAGQLNGSGERQVALRANGSHRINREEFAPEAKRFRDQLASGDAVAAEAVRAVVTDEVEGRVVTLGEAVPEQFGAAASEGLTPTQAVVVTYSVLADDDLAGSTADVGKRAAQAPNKKAKKDKPTVGYGPDGRLFSSPTNLFFNRESMGRFLDRIEKGGNGQ